MNTERLLWLIVPVIAVALIISFIRSPHRSLDEVQFRDLKQRAESGDVKAQFDVAIFYGRGQGIQKNETLADHWLHKAAEQGEPRSQDFLGSRILSAKNASVEEKQKAISLLQESAKQGWVKGQLHLGLAYLSGQDVAKDDTLAHTWLRKAAEQGETEAQYRLGCLQIQGGSQVKDEVQGVEWVRKAAETGYPQAQWSLGTAYATATGIQRDYVQAYKWLTLALDQGKGDKLKLNDVAQKMTLEQIEKAEQLAHDFKPTEPRSLRQ